jgi:translation elongation factor EF-1alpha
MPMYPTNTVVWDFEEIYNRVVYPQGLKNKYITFATKCKETRVTPILSEDKEEQEYFSSPDNVFISSAFIESNELCYGKIITNSRIEKFNKNYSYKFVIKGLSISLLPVAQRNIVSSFFYALVSVSQLKQNYYKIYSIF